MKEKKYVGVEEIAKVSELPMRDVNRVFSAIILLLRRNDEVKIRGFGKFTSRFYAARDVKNFGKKSRKKVLRVAAHKVLHFNSSKRANVQLSVPVVKD